MPTRYSTPVSDTHSAAPVLTEQQRQRPTLRWLDRTGRLLDNRFRIPGTNIRFGLDFIIGLIPGAGDLFSFGISGFLVLMMARNGASGKVVAKMIGNIVIDTVVGAIPLLGDLFDLGFKSNIRNLKLLREHYKEGEHQGNAWPVIIGLAIVFIVLLVFFLWLIWQIVDWSFGLLGF